MNLDYFLKINNTYKSKSRQETDLYLLNRHVDRYFDDTIDYAKVERNGEPFELLIIKDTDGNTYKKKIKSKHSDPFNLGDYIVWQNQIWLITLLDPNDKTYHSGYMYLCTIPLRWQNSKGEIIERWAYSEDFTKYSTGIYGNEIVKIGENQYGLTLPLDEETRVFKRDMRFPIDFDDIEEPDVYRLSNKKGLLNNDEYFGRGGTVKLTMSLDAFNKDKDRRVAMEDGKSVWICDYVDQVVQSAPSSSDEEKKGIVSVKIKYTGMPVIKCGGSEKIFTGIFAVSDLKVPCNGQCNGCNAQCEWYDTMSDDSSDTQDIDDMELNFTWDVQCDFKERLGIIISGNQIKIKVSDKDEDLIGKSFDLIYQNTETGLSDTLSVSIESFL